MKHLAVASGLLFATVPATAAMDIGEQMWAAYNSCLSQYPQQTIVGLVATRSCIVEREAAIRAANRTRLGLTNAQVAVYLRHAQAIDVRQKHNRTITAFPAGTVGYDLGLLSQ
jgi:hypothetical protein